MTKRKLHSPKFKARVALEALKGIEPAGVLAARFSVHPSMISRWKNQLLEQAEEAFSNERSPTAEQSEALQPELYEQIGRLKMELEWLKKKLTPSVEARRALVEPDHPMISVRRPCALVGLNRSTYYYEPARETQENLHLMRLIDQEYLRHPFYGVLRHQEDDRTPLSNRPPGQPQADPTPDAADGPGGDLAEDEPGPGRAPNLPVAVRPGLDHGPRPALER